MCAIFGYNSSNVNAKDFHRLLIHRGPDYQKNLNFLNFTVGHNLLAIRDEVEKSIQPVETDNQRFIFSDIIFFPIWEFIHLVLCIEFKGVIYHDSWRYFFIHNETLDYFIPCSKNR